MFNPATFDFSSAFGGLGAAAGAGGAGAAGAAGAAAGGLGAAGPLSMIGGPLGLAAAGLGFVGGLLQSNAQAKAQSAAMAYDWARSKRDQAFGLASQNAFRDSSTAAAQGLEQVLPFARRSGLGRTEAFEKLLSVMPASAARRESFFNV